MIGRQLRVALVASALLAQAACATCGRLETSGLTATDAEGRMYNGVWGESCGANRGTSGTWNLYGDSAAHVMFFPTAPGDRGWMAIDLNLEIAFPTSALVQDAVLTDLAGGAFVNPGLTLSEDLASLTDGEVEVLSVSGLDDPCADDGPQARLSWDLTFDSGVDGGPRYEARGTDVILFSNFLSEDCPGL